jgi:hypothetical protein
LAHAHELGDTHAECQFHLAAAQAQKAALCLQHERELQQLRTHLHEKSQQLQVQVDMQVAQLGEQLQRVALRPA